MNFAWSERSRLFSGAMGIVFTCALMVTIIMRKIARAVPITVTMPITGWLRMSVQASFIIFIALIINSS